MGSGEDRVGQGPAMTPRLDPAREAQARRLATYETILEPSKEIVRDLLAELDRLRADVARVAEERDGAIAGRTVQQQFAEDYCTRLATTTTALEAAQASDAESVAMYQRARDRADQATTALATVRAAARGAVETHEAVNDYLADREDADCTGDPPTMHPNEAMTLRLELKSRTRALRDALAASESPPQGAGQP